MIPILLDTIKAAQILGVNPNTLASWRRYIEPGSKVPPPHLPYPRWHRVGPKLVRYREDELIEDARRIDG